MTTITIQNGHIETIFSIFYECVKCEGGDGIGVLLCDNPEEMAQKFYKWGKSTWPGGKKRHIPEDLDISENHWNYHTNNENFIITSNKKEAECKMNDFLIIIDGDIRE